MVDTAGIRDTEDVVEKIGVSRAMEAAKNADLIIYVVDGSTELDENDRNIIRLIQGRKAVVLLNKSDLDMKVGQEELELLTGRRVLPVSAREETGIELLEQEIQTMFFQGGLHFNDQVYITNARHKAALEDGARSIAMVRRSIADGMPEDFYSIDLMDAYQKLGTIVGEAVGEDLVNEIFSKFCMGK